MSKDCLTLQITHLREDNASNKSHCICYMNWRRKTTEQVEKDLSQTPLKVVKEEIGRRYYGTTLFKLRRSDVNQSDHQ